MSTFRSLLKRRPILIILCARIRPILQQQHPSDIQMPALRRQMQRRPCVLGARVGIMLEQHASDAPMPTLYRPVQRRPLLLSLGVRVGIVPRATFSCPHCDARCSAVHLSSSGARASAPWSSSSRTTDRCPPSDARWSGDHPSSSCAPAFAPCSRSTRSTSRCPLCDAACNVVDLTHPRPTRRYHDFRGPERCPNACLEIPSVMESSCPRPGL